MKTYKTLLLSLITICSLSISNDLSAKKRDLYNYKKMPELLREFVNTRFQAYFCYNLCTFKNANVHDRHWERTYGDEPVSLYKPTGKLNTDQWAEMCKNAKMAGGWLITKHHDGFCVWDSKLTTYDVGSCEDKTDVVGKFLKSFRKAGLKVGLYFSILDYHQNVNYRTVGPKELEFTKGQIRELLTNYGPIDYINFDAWATWKTHPDFDDIHYGEILALVKELQPHCLIVSHTYESNLAHAEIPFADAAGRNYPYHPDYFRPVAGSDSILSGWWWDDDHHKTKSVDYILNKLDSYNSHNGVYILNIPPTVDGLIDDRSMAVMKEVGERWNRPADIEKPGDNWGYGYNVNKSKSYQKRATQSSTDKYIRDKRSYPRAEIAVDGVTEGCSEMEQTSITQKEDNPWWRVDLGEVCKVKKITIYNCTDKYKNTLNNFTVELLDSNNQRVWSKTITQIPDPMVTIELNREKGQYVKITLNGHGQLALGEVIIE